MNRPLISVVTVCFNSESTLERTLNSVFSQAFPRYEYIIINGNSTDNTAAIIESYSNMFSHVIAESDNGIYDAMNKGLRLATGEYILFLNSDDYLANDNIFYTVNNLHMSLSSSHIIAGSIAFIPPSNCGAIIKQRPPWTSSKSSFTDNPLFFKQNPHPAIFFPNSILKSNNISYNTQLQISADLQLQLQLYKLCVPLYVHNEIWTYMSLGGKSTRSLYSYLSGYLESAQAYNNVYKNGGNLFALIKIFRKIILSILDVRSIFNSKHVS